MTGITLERPLRTEIIVYFHCGFLQKLLADKRQNKSKVTLNPMILTEQFKKINRRKAIKEKQSNDVDIFLFEFQISEKFSLDQVLEGITRFCFFNTYFKAIPNGCSPV